MIISTLLRSNNSYVHIQIADLCGTQLQTFGNYMRHSAKRLAQQSPITNVLIKHAIPQTIRKIRKYTVCIIANIIFASTFHLRMTKMWTMTSVLLIRCILARYFLSIRCRRDWGSLAQEASWHCIYLWQKKQWKSYRKISFCKISAIYIICINLSHYWSKLATCSMYFTYYKGTI